MIQDKCNQLRLCLEEEKNLLSEDEELDESEYEDPN